MKLRFGKWGMRLLGVGFTVAWMAPAAGQQEVPVCSKEQEMVGTLGIEQFACGPCSQIFRGGREIWRFDAEPIIQAVRMDGPASKKLQAGDEVVAVDGILITTAEGGLRWSRIEAGENVTLLVRRRGRREEVNITAGGKCVTLRRGGEDRRDWVLTHPGPPEQGRTLINAESDGAWFGFIIEIQRPSAADPSVGDRYPEVLAVDEDGPARRGGLRQGDVILEADRESLATSQGLWRLSNATPGIPVELLVRRGATTVGLLVTPQTETDVGEEGEIGRQELIRRLNGLRLMDDLDEVRQEVDRLLSDLRRGGGKE